MAKKVDIRGDTSGRSGLVRFSKELSYSISNVLNNSPVIPFESMAGGVIHIPTGSPITALAYYSVSIGDVAYPLYDSAGVAVAQVVAGNRAYELPDACFGVRRLKIVSNSPGPVLLTVKG